MGQFFLFFFVIPFYKRYINFSKIFSKFYAPQKSRHHLIHPFSRRYLNHVVIIIFAVFTFAANINANEVRKENFGETSIVASLFINEDLGVIAEEGPISYSTKQTYYLGSTGVSIKPQIVASDEEIIPSTIAGGSAILSPILSPMEAQSSTRDKAISYAVEIGDTISQIAAKFGISVSSILWENNLTAYSLIRPGDTLTILPTSGITHKVLKGETLSKIAAKYDIELEKIVEFNKLASAADITPGETLIIPGGKKIYAQPAATVRKSYTAPTNKPAITSVSGSGKMVWPSACRHISQYYGWRHSGLDIACPHGTGIYAANSGRVITALGGWNGGYGNYVIIDHGSGVQTLYGHLSVIYVSKGESIGRGQIIGAEGSTGRSTGPHLHFEVRSGGSRLNPLYYIK